MSIASSCVRDGFRFGEWLPHAFHASAAGSACSNLTYTNRTCLPHTLSRESLCAALQHGGSSQQHSVLLVGDSLMLKLFEALMEAMKVRKFELEPCSGSGSKKACHPCCCKAFTLPCQSTSVRIRFVRHNHLLGSFLPHASKVVCPSCGPACQDDGVQEGRREDCAACTKCRKVLAARTLCGTWSGRETLDRADTLVLGTGSHVLEVPGWSNSSALASGGVFARRAEELASFLAARHPRRNVYMVSPWGELDYHTHYSGPAVEPAPPHHTFGWDQIPKINDLYARAVRERGYTVIDPTLALSRRRDCRIDYIHSKTAIYAQSTWRMMLAAMDAMGQ